MYIIIDKTTGESFKHEGHWPLQFVDGLVAKKHKVLVISTYSNTIKVFNGKYDIVFDGWHYDEYDLPTNLEVRFRG